MGGREGRGGGGGGGGWGVRNRGTKVRLNWLAGLYIVHRTYWLRTRHTSKGMYKAAYYMSNKLCEPKCFY